MISIHGFSLGPMIVTFWDGVLDFWWPWTNAYLAVGPGGWAFHSSLTMRV